LFDFLKGTYLVPERKLVKFKYFLSLRTTKEWSNLMIY